MAELGFPRVAAMPSTLMRLLPIIAAALAVAIGIAVGDPTSTGMLLLGALVGLAVLVVTVLRPRVGLYALAFSTMILMVVVVRPPRGLNAFDVFLLPVLAASVWGAARRDAARRAAAETGAGHAAIRGATQKLKRAVLLYFLVALISLVPGLFTGHVARSLDATLMLVRVIQGALLFPLATWWIDSERRIHHTIDAMLIGGAALVAVNVVHLATAGVKRAGMTWFLNQPDWPIDSPNEAATATLLLSTLLLARHAVRAQLRNHLMIAGSVLMLVLSLSRSGIVAWSTFVIMRLRRIGWRRAVLAVVLLAALVPLTPREYRERMGRSLAFERGSFERYSIAIRLFTYQTAWKVFVDHPLLGVGYLNFRFVSESYNNLHFVIPTTENFMLETATGMGVVGLAAVALVVVRLFQLGRTIARVAPRQSLAHHLAGYHGALMASLFAASLTGSVFVGMVAVAQLALWTAIVVRSGHQSLGGGSG